jgi:hypothetical protein
LQFVRDWIISEPDPQDKVASDFCRIANARENSPRLIGV